MSDSADVVAMYLIENGYDARAYGDEPDWFARIVDIKMGTFELRFYIEGQKVICEKSPFDTSIDLAHPESLEMILDALEQCKHVWCAKCILSKGHIA